MWRREAGRQAGGQLGRVLQFAKLTRISLEVKSRLPSMTERCARIGKFDFRVVKARRIDCPSLAAAPHASSLAPAQLESPRLMVTCLIRSCLGLNDGGECRHLDRWNMLLDMICRHTDYRTTSSTRAGRAETSHWDSPWLTREQESMLCHMLRRQRKRPCPPFFA